MFHFWWEKYKARHLSKRVPGGSSLVWARLFLHLSCKGARRTELRIAADNARERFCLRPQIQSLRTTAMHGAVQNIDLSCWGTATHVNTVCRYFMERKWPKRFTLIPPPLIRRIIPTSCDSWAGSVCQSYDRLFISASDKCVALSWWNQFSRHGMLPFYFR